LVQKGLGRLLESETKIMNL